MITFPAPICAMIAELEKHGFTAFLVGGCVRDFLLEIEPHDYDIATSATPDEIMNIFGEEHCSFYGRAFGTVGVKYQGEFAEITTFRTEGNYTDSRHPDSVAFTTEPLEDMSRRDFTCNAIAYHPQNGLFDPFHGEDDLKNGILRAVGNPSARFEEDALRIMRGMRFYSKFGLKPEPLTDSAMREYAPNLEKISVERVFTELCGMLTGEHITEVLLQYPEILAVWIPEIMPCVGFEQHSRHHDFTVWEHIARTVGNIAPELTFRLTMLLHDIAKPCCYTRDERGGHFKGHAQLGAKMADEILKRLRCDNQLRERVCTLIDYHRETPATLPRVRTILGIIGEEAFRQYLQVLKSDNISKLKGEPEQGDEIRIQEANRLLQKCLDEHLCCTLKDLAINGNDVMKLGIAGQNIGEALHTGLTAVIEEQIPNEKDDLLQFITEKYKIPYQSE